MPTTKKAGPKTPAHDRVWIEMDRPRDAAHADAICDKANRMLERLGVADTHRFWYHDREAIYCLGGQAGYVTLSDRGHWFNLDFLGREPAAVPGRTVAVSR